MRKFSLIAAVVVASASSWATSNADAQVYVYPRASAGIATRNYVPSVNGRVYSNVPRTYQSYRPTYNTPNYYSNGRIYSNPNNVYYGNSPRYGNFQSGNRAFYGNQRYGNVYGNQFGNGYYMTPRQSANVNTGAALGGLIGGQRGAQIGAAIGANARP